MASLTKGRGDVPGLQGSSSTQHTEALCVYHGSLGVEQGLCILSYGETTDNWQVTERKKMVWSSHQSGVGHITGEATVPGPHRWTL